MLKRTLKYMTSKTEQQIIAIYILPNVSKSKDSQGFKFVHLKKT